ncbi:adenosylcobinamide-GDP ribazoletransferase [Burkholderia dolosa]|uniref:Adenosylcobinamide-GDP ribazoletransferase n=1 Tax=Burkholderia dolosa TaxID=152500 RepID=A0A892I506_9BURK|nr:MULTISPECIES: adenosylcobinamide-GDP ribazoletransferase [Burkholderia]AKE02959.1 cobalamin synthase [Burkholderia cepacia]AJY14470.1 cobalamin-5-phosphate synthase family protein [Burkholderia dolosa AU0158]AYZ97709.1 adenosylcobinamide-GDP ribazoletransferase [Burkholderia dolosa]ETP64784.1 cobalamin synthase [Burkholderia dolosa PC543]MBR8417769.1 adenosylcobinamide-GDP ribazoletransferase [Burkholderia dolosa]
MTRERVRGIRAELRYFFVALGYFTRVPVPRAIGYAAGDLDQAARYFPLVGAWVGAWGALVYLVASRALPASIAVGLSMAATLVATGAFHEDGLADSCDAFGGGYTRDDVLRIMHDSRIGTFGAVALVIALGVKWQALAAMPPRLAAWTMIAAHAASRAGAVSLLMSLDYVRPEGKAKPVAQRMGARAACVAAAFGLPWLFWPDWRAGVAACVALVLVRAWAARYFVKRIGGYTGDCLGFAQQLGEIAIYLVALGWISS